MRFLNKRILTRAILPLLLAAGLSACTTVMIPPPRLPSERPPVTSAATEQVTQPTTHPVTDPATEPATDPVTDPVTEPTTEPNTEPVTEPVTEPATEPVTEPVTEPATEPTTEPATEPATEPTTEPATEPATEPVTEPVTDPVTEGETEPTTEPPHTHVWSEWVKAPAPTCTADGLQTRSCTCGETEQERIPALGHTMEDGVCTVCGSDEIDFTDPTLYASDYGYDHLGTLTNGDALQGFYTRLDEALLAFHEDETLDAAIKQDTPTLPADIDYADLGLSYDEAELAWRCLLNDRPLYYWIGKTWTYNATAGWFRVHVGEEYASGADRAAFNQTIYEAIEEYYTVVSGEDSEYLISLAYHDLILSAIDYAYEDDGVTPRDDLWAHSILGVFTEQGVVCEGYAKAYQMLLTLSGVENIYVCGVAGGVGHAWNLIQLDDGAWYWADITWDDQETVFRGIMYNYFAVSDSQLTDWKDAHHGWQTPEAGTVGFTDEHTCDVDYPLPERAEEPFTDADVVELRETFTVGENTYALAGYGKVQLVATQAEGHLQIPATVEYAGRLYEVTSFGAINEAGYFLQGAVVGEEAAITEITVPAGVLTIDMGAFIQCQTLERVTLSEGAEVINHQAFFNCEALTEIHLPKSMTALGLQAFAYCFSLEDIHYAGTLEEWDAIVKGEAWNQGCPALTVHCSDGDLTIPAAQG